MIRKVVSGDDQLQGKAVAPILFFPAWGTVLVSYDSLNIELPLRGRFFYAQGHRMEYAGLL